MMLRFSGKVIIVTGATSGIGEKVALRFAENGAKVVVVGRREETGKSIVELIKTNGGEAIFVMADVTRESDVIEMVRVTLAHYGQLNFAFNCAGVKGNIGPITECTEEQWDFVIDNNLKSMFLCLKHQIPAMLQGSGGVIVNMSSLWGLRASDMGTAHYNASKHGVTGLTKSAALEFAKQNIRVNEICCGWIPTGSNEKRLQENPEVNSAACNAVPVGHLGSTDEIASAVMWLCEQENGFMTGQSIILDGGMSINAAIM